MSFQAAVEVPGRGSSFEHSGRILVGPTSLSYSVSCCRRAGHLELAGWSEHNSVTLLRAGLPRKARLSARLQTLGKAPGALPRGPRAGFPWPGACPPVSGTLRPPQAQSGPEFQNQPGHPCPIPCEHALLSQTCQGKAPQTAWPETTDACSLTVLEVRGQSSGVSRATLLPKALWGQSFLASPPSRSPACGHIPPICLCLFSWGHQMLDSAPPPTPARPHVSTMTSAETLFPNKVTLIGTSGCDFNIIFRGKRFNF